MSFLRQVWLILADRFLRERELIFRLDADDVSMNQITLPKELRFREVTAWEELPKNFRARVMDPSSDLEWNGHDWFGKRRRLWVGFWNENVATLGWWCGPDEAGTHFYQIPQDSELFIHAMTLSEYRGRNLHRLLRLTCMQDRCKRGVRAFYVHCRDYNTPSRRNIEKMGFRQVGYIVKWRVLRHEVQNLDTPECVAR